MYKKSSKQGGQQYLMKAVSKGSLLVSCKQITQHPLTSMTFI
jgi:hypothetical protein